MADPGQGLGLANLNGVANQGRAGLRDVCETQCSRHQGDGEPGRTNHLECHGIFSLLSNCFNFQETRRFKMEGC